MFKKRLNKIGISLLASIGIGCLLTGCSSNKKPKTHHHIQQSSVSIANTIKPFDNQVYYQISSTNLTTDKRDYPKLFYRFKGNKIYLQPVQDHIKDIISHINHAYETDGIKYIKNKPLKQRQIAGTKVVQSYKQLILAEKGQNDNHSIIHINSIHKSHNIYHIKGTEYVYEFAYKGHISLNKIHMDMSIKLTKSGLDLLNYNHKSIKHGDFNKTNNSYAKHMLNSNHIKQNRLDY